MSSFLTSATLIDSVKRRHSIPISQNTFQEADLLAFANEEISMGLVPLILQFHEEFFVASQTVAMVANKSNYPIPARAIGGKLRDLFFRDTNGNLREMSRILPDDKAYYQNTGGDSFFHKFYLQSNEVIVTPNVAGSPTGSLVMTYFLRPNQLVDDSRAGAITAINALTGVITLATMPTNFTVGSLIDLVETHGHHKTKGMDVAILAVDTSALTVTIAVADVPSDLVIGDYINTSEESIIPQIPDELHALLAQRVAARCLEALGDVANLNSANTKISEMEQKTGAVIDNRVEGSPQKVVNRHNLLRAGKIGIRRRSVW